MSAIQELYQQVILDHNRSPRNFRTMENATRSAEGFNPLCGDHYTVFVRMEGETVADISFDGAGCAISKASASVMSSMLKGKERAEALQTFEEFHALVTRGLPEGKEVEDFGRLGAFAGVSEFPARVKCAILPWYALRSALTSEGTPVTTEEAR
jgi:nitrogen fixation NifU-like protein